MATGTSNRPLAIEVGQATTLITFSSVAKNNCIKIGNLCFVEFTAVLGQNTGVWTDFIKLPFGINLNEEAMCIAVYNDSPTALSIHNNTGDTKVSVAASMASGKKIAVSAFYSV